MKKIIGAATAAVAVCAIPGYALAQMSNDIVKIGVIVDQTGVYSSNGGPGAIKAVEMAIKDFGGKVNGKPIQIVSADYQNKVDIAMTKAREWIDR
ncbi:MAG TPA: ABC transporter substrate-binding protein, partial [Burkholderiaceae bacterium]|nr:ABC transporter substrate-binding protein [Burkholderiaceae bacterium]